MLKLLQMMVLVALQVPVGYALAAPSCDKNPGHPSCGGGGGGDGGGGSPANPALVFWDGRDSIDVADANGANQITLMSGVYGACTYPKWSPDGERITYTNQGRIFVMNKDGAGKVDITPNGIGWSGACAIDWSQGSVLGGDDLIAFVGVPDGLDVGFPAETDYDDVYLLNPDTGEAHNLTNTFGVSENAVSWSHGGTRLAVTRIDFADTSHQQLVILELEVADGIPQVATELDVTPPLPVFAPWNNVSWATHGDRILYASEDSLSMISFDSSGLVSVEAVTGGPGQFALGRQFFATWSPQDDEIAFVVAGGIHDVKPKDTGVYRMDLAIGTTEKIINQGPRWPDWRPTWQQGN